MSTVQQSGCACCGTARIVQLVELRPAAALPGGARPDLVCTLDGGLDALRGCSFFTFSLTVAPEGMRFTIKAPDEARDVVAAVFGPATAGAVT